jgi:hypothetical protein
MIESGISRREWAWLSAAIALSLLVHGAFVLKGLADNDAAWLGWQTAVWTQTGELPAWYSVRTSPLYLHGLKAVIDMGLPIRLLPAFMNWTSVLLGSLAIVPLYLLWRRQTGVAESVMALVICSFMPVLWLGNIHGMPNVPSSFFFCCGLLLFCEGLNRRGEAASAWFAAAFLLATIGIALKADTFLCYGAFLWFAIRHRPLKPGKIALAMAVPVVGLLATMIYTRFIAASGHASAESVSREWPFSWELMASLFNLAVTPMAMGMVLFVVTGVCILYAMARWKYVNILGLVLFWSAPTILFWCFYGNVARHLTAACYPVALLVAVVIVGEFRKVQVWGPVIATILAVNYLACPAFALPHMIRPSSRLFEARRQIQARMDSWHDAGKVFAMLPDEHKALYGNGYIIYAKWEMASRSKSFRCDEKGGWIFVDAAGRQQRAKFYYVPDNQLLPQTEPGWNSYQWIDTGQGGRIEPAPAVTGP